MIIESDGEQITGARGDPEHPANFGRLCSKGSTLHLTAARPVTLQTRLLQPMQRRRLLQLKLQMLLMLQTLNQMMMWQKFDLLVLREDPKPPA